MERAAFARFRQPIPDDLWPPDFLPGAAEWYEAFWEMSSDRNIGMEYGPIPSHSIRSFAAELHESEQVPFRRIIRKMDQVFLDHARKSGAGKEHPERVKLKVRK